jgi:hypothetical protein
VEAHRVDLLEVVEEMVALDRDLQRIDQILGLVERNGEIHVVRIARIHVLPNGVVGRNARPFPLPKAIPPGLPLAGLFLRRRIEEQRLSLIGCGKLFVIIGICLVGFGRI